MMSRNDIPPSHDDLIQDYLESEASPTEEKQFRLLLGEESFRRRVAQYAIDLGHLSDFARQGILGGLLAPRRNANPKRTHAYLGATIAASVLVAIGIAFLFAQSRDRHREQAHEEPVTPPVAQRQEPLFVAHVANVVGEVMVADNPDFEAAHVVGQDEKLHPGEFLKTVGARSFALLKFADESVLAVAGKTSLACSITDSQKRIVVLGGDVMAQVAEQPPGKPMLIETPKAHAEVVGTKLSLFASLLVTKLTVLEGHVRLKRVSDGSTVDVKGGQAAIASDTTPLAVNPLPSVDSLWQEDFEQGLPANWESGMWVQDNLPPGAKGAVRATVPEGGEDEADSQFFVTSPHEWWQGLFRVESDTYINFTYRVTRLGWFNLMVETRSDGAKPTYSGAFLYKNPDMWKTGVDQWRTVSLPLRGFRSPQGARIKREAPLIGHLVYRFYFSTQETDPGLVIDRIWITRGPAKAAEVLGASK